MGSRRLTKEWSASLDGDVCWRCGKSECSCARFQGFKVAKWEGKKRNFSFSDDELLRVAFAKAIRKRAPLDMVIAALRHFVETEGPREATLQTTQQGGPNGS